jgi:hypothetical protein
MEKDLWSSFAKYPSPLPVDGPVTPPRNPYLGLDQILVPLLTEMEVFRPFLYNAILYISLLLLPHIIPSLLSFTVLYLF